MAREKQQVQKGHVIVSPTRGVFLGSGRWSFDKGHRKAKRAPIFTDADDEMVAGLGVQDALAHEVDQDGTGFASRTGLENAGHVWAPADTPQDEDHGVKVDKPKKKKGR